MPHPDQHRTPPAVLERWMAQAIRQREAAERANESLCAYCDGRLHDTYCRDCDTFVELHGATERFLIDSINEGGRA